MRKKIIGSYVIIIVILAASFTWIVNSSLVDSMLVQYKQNFINEAKLTERMFTSAYDENFDIAGFADEVKQLTGVRVTIIDKSGVVLADSDEDPAVMNNHLNRDEVIDAINTGEASTALRYSNTLKTDYLYSAITTKDDGKFIIRVSKPLTAIKELTRKIENFAFISIALAAILALISSIFISKKITEPIYQLTEAANEIAKGDYGKKIYNQSKDQIGDLTNSFNVMSETLKHSVLEIKSRNVELESILNSMINGIIAIDKNRNILMINKISFEILRIPEDFVVENESMYKIVRNEEMAEMVEKSISEGTSQIKELQYVHLDKILRIYINPIKTSNDEIIGSIIVIQDVTQIRKLEQVRSDFVSNVSHELKTPLTSIKGFVDTLKQGAIDERDTAMRFLDIIDIESDRLYRLINDILILSEIESMDREIESNEISLNEVLEEVVEMLSQKAEEKNIKLTSTVDGSYNINANRDRIKQMLINLIDNAVKYTEKGEVTIEIKSKEPWISISVADTGIGFSDDHKDRLFERFYRVDKGRSRSQGGTGLGLSIVKHIVLLYKGKISVESTPDKGTRFEILLPNKETLNLLKIKNN